MCLTKKKVLTLKNVPDIWMQESLSVDPRIVQDFVVALILCKILRYQVQRYIAFFFAKVHRYIANTLKRTLKATTAHK